MEHLQHFSLAQDPFQNEPDLRFYFECAATIGAQRRLERGLRQSKGLSLLTGEGGVGKTLLARRIYESLEEEVFEAVMLVMLPGATDAEALLNRFARQLGIEEIATDRSGLIAQVYEQLAVVREDGRHTILIIDNAHLLEPGALAALGGLSNLEYEDRRLLSLLLVGLPELDAMLGCAPSLGQRVDVRVQLDGLDLESARAYLDHRIDCVGGSQAILPAPAVEALFRTASGRPRLMNTLADNALFEAFLAGRSAMEPEDVGRAASDLGLDSSESGSSGPPSTPELSLAAELTDPETGPAFDAEPVFGDGDSLDGALELADPVPDDVVGGDRTTVLQMGPETVEAPRDLDAEVASMLDESPPALGDSMLELTPDSSLAQAEETRIAFPDEEPPKDDEEAEIDELFVELMDD